MEYDARTSNNWLSYSYTFLYIICARINSLALNQVRPDEGMPTTYIAL